MELLVKKWQCLSVMLQPGLFPDASKLRLCQQLPQLAEMPCMSLLKWNRHALEKYTEGGGNLQRPRKLPRPLPVRAGPNTSVLTDPTLSFPGQERKVRLD